MMELLLQATNGIHKHSHHFPLFIQHVFALTDHLVKRCRGATKNGRAISHGTENTNQHATFLL